MAAATVVAAALCLRRLVAFAVLGAEFVAAIEALGRDGTVAPFVFARFHAGKGAAAVGRRKRDTVVAAMRALAVFVVVLVAASGCRRHPRGAPDAGVRAGVLSLDEQAGDLATTALTLDRVAALPQTSVNEWNRALVLRALGLVRGAAAAFDAVAVCGEPGWAGDAKSQAA